MEAKKNPAKDVHRQSAKFFLIGLSISVSLAIMAFEWTSEKRKQVDRSYEKPHEEIMMVRPTVHEYAKPPEIIPVKKVTVVTPLVRLVETDTEPEQKTDEIPDAESPHIPVDPGLFTIPPDDSVDFFIAPEVSPKPIGGYELFYQQISKSLKYPKPAARQEIEGKVYVEFIIDKNGVPTNLIMLKGIGGGCDEEAMRVIAKTRWEPGKQRGKPVRVKMAMPIVFKMN